MIKSEWYEDVKNYLHTTGRNRLGLLEIQNDYWLSSYSFYTTVTVT